VSSTFNTQFVLVIKSS